MPSGRQAVDTRGVISLKSEILERCITSMQVYLLTVEIGGEMGTISSDRREFVRSKMHVGFPTEKQEPIPHAI